MGPSLGTEYHDAWLILLKAFLHMLYRPFLLFPFSAFKESFVTIIMCLRLWVCKHHGAEAEGRGQL